MTENVVGLLLMSALLTAMTVLTLINKPDVGPVLLISFIVLSFSLGYGVRESITNRIKKESTDREKLEHFEQR